jgi:hypothetical protein
VSATLEETKETESVRGLGPIDTDDPVAICARLGEIEDELAMLQPKLSRAAHWRVRYADDIARVIGSLRPQGANAEERKFNQAQHLEAHYGEALLDKKTAADAEYAQHTKTFDLLDARRSILQSCLKRLLRDQEPQHGSGAHH